MVEDERYCTGVLTQINAVTGALQQVAHGLLAGHMRHCVLDAAKSAPAAGEESSVKPQQRSQVSGRPARFHTISSIRVLAESAADLTIELTGTQNVSS
jgi:Metal-sensitive transcriptional repressor